MRLAPAEQAGDNSDGRRLDLDNETSAAHPVGAYRAEEVLFRGAAKDRKWLGDVFVCLHLLVSDLPRHNLGALISALPEVASYAGADCSPEWLSYLRRPLPEACELVRVRLQETLGVAEEELRAGQARLESADWSLALVAARLEQLLLEKSAVEAAADHPLTTALGQASDAVDASAVKDMVAHMTAPGWPPRRHDNGLAGAAAMPPRLRREPSGSAPPCLPLACKLCEASYPTAATLRRHLRCVHGGDQRARARHGSAWSGSAPIS